jgi:hypothetical protein
LTQVAIGHDADQPVIMDHRDAPKSSGFHLFLDGGKEIIRSDHHRILGHVFADDHERLLLCRRFEGLSELAAFPAKLGLGERVQARRFDRPMASAARAEGPVSYTGDRALDARKFSSVKLRQVIDGSRCIIVPRLIHPIEVAVPSNLLALLSEVLEDRGDLLSSSEKPFFVSPDRDCCFHKRLLPDDESSKNDALGKSAIRRREARGFLHK